jgi:hypothetical protein
VTRRALLVAAFLAVPAAASAAPSTQLTFSSTAPGTSTAFHAQIAYDSTDPAGQRRALRRHELVFPPGTAYDSAAAGNCQASAEEIESSGLGACPADSRVGGGTLRAAATKPPASSAGSFPTDLTFFNSSHPKDAPAAEHALIVAVSVGGQVRTAFVVPVEGNVATEITPMVCSTPGEEPPCPNGEFTASSVDYTIEERTRTVGGRTHRLMTTPPTCPGPGPGAWTFESRREYRDGARATVTYKMGCARGTAAAAPELRLAVAPRRARRCRATRFVFAATTGGGRLAGGTVRFANQRAVTDENGRAEIVARLCRLGDRRATVKADGFRKGTARVRVVR